METARILQTENKSSLFCPNCKSGSFVKHGKSKKRGVQNYKCRECGKCFLESITPSSRPEFLSSEDPSAEYEKDVWDIRNLGVQPGPALCRYKLNFTTIFPFWLRQAAKQCVRHTLATLTFNTADYRLTGIKCFSKFLAEKHPGIEPSSINRKIIVEYMGWMLGRRMPASTRNGRLASLRTLFDLCVRFNWADIPDKPLIYKEDNVKEGEYQPRYIPQEVLNQLNQNLDYLPEPIMRMVLVIQQCGMRISELCLLKFNCITQDVQKDWFLTYHQFKLKKDHTIPIDKELAAIIQEQQKYIRNNLGNDFLYLFCSRKRMKGFHPNKAPITSQTFVRALKDMAKERNIKSNSGEIWSFQSHQFRHTTFTTMINNGVPLHIVQRYAGHVSPEMTMRYAHIFDQTLKEEFAKFKDKMVDVTGKVVSYESVAAQIAEGLDPNSIDAQWLKKNIRAQALPNGLCGLPINQPACPYGANKCLTGPDGKGCLHFKTDSRYLDKHKEHLARTSEIVEWAQENPSAKRAEEILKVNLPVKQNLERIVVSLETQCSTQQ